MKAEMQRLEGSVDETMPKEELYDVLVGAYFIAKDVIELQGGETPIIEDTGIADKLEEAEIALTEARLTIGALQTEAATANEAVVGINQKYANALSNIQKELDTAAEQ